MKGGKKEILIISAILIALLLVIILLEIMDDEPSYSPTLREEISLGDLGAKSTTTYSDSYGLCGDVNGDGIIASGDLIYLINFVFKGGPAPELLWTGDVNGDGSVSSADVVYLINAIFKGGPSPDCKEFDLEMNWIGLSDYTPDIGEEVLLTRRIKNVGKVDGFITDYSSEVCCRAGGCLSSPPLCYEVKGWKSEGGPEVPPQIQINKGETKNILDIMKYNFSRNGLYEIRGNVVGNSISRVADAYPENNEYSAYSLVGEDNDDFTMAVCGDNFCGNVEKWVEEGDTFEIAINRDTFNIDILQIGENLGVPFARVIVNGEEEFVYQEEFDKVKGLRIYMRKGIPISKRAYITFGEHYLFCGNDCPNPLTCGDDICESLEIKLPLRSKRIIFEDGNPRDIELLSIQPGNVAQIRVGIHGGLIAEGSEHTINGLKMYVKKVFRSPDEVILQIGEENTGSCFIDCPSLT